MTFTAAHYAAGIAAAHTSRRDSARDGGLAVWLLAEQNGTCFDCDNAPATEFAHFTRAQGRTTASGHVLGAMACRRCNIIHDRITAALGTDGTLPLAYLMADGRADRIPTDYPIRTDLVSIHSRTLRAAEESLASDVDAALAAL